MEATTETMTLREAHDYLQFFLKASFLDLDYKINLTADVINVGGYCITDSNSLKLSMEVQDDGYVVLRSFDCLDDTIVSVIKSRLNLRDAVVMTAQMLGIEAKAKAQAKETTSDNVVKQGV